MGHMLTIKVKKETVPHYGEGLSLYFQNQKLHDGVWPDLANLRAFWHDRQHQLKMYQSFYDHNELQDNEIFLANISNIERFHIRFKSLKTIRLGKQAYDINGNELPTDKHWPMFICKSELAAYNRIMQTN